MFRATRKRKTAREGNEKHRGATALNVGRHAPHIICIVKRKQRPVGVHYIRVYDLGAYFTHYF